MTIRKKATISRTRKAEYLRRCARIMAASEPWLTLGLDYRACLASVSGPLREVYAARLGGKSLGFVIVEMNGSFKGYIKAICVAPEARGLGLGSRLMAFAERRIFRETPNVFLCVSSFNRGARRLYARLGYATAGILRDFIVKGSHELLLRKTLGPLRGRRGGAKRS